jgi:hypothetical protein
MVNTTLVRGHHAQTRRTAGNFLIFHTVTVSLNNKRYIIIFDWGRRYSQVRFPAIQSYPSTVYSTVLNKFAHISQQYFIFPHFFTTSNVIDLGFFLLCKHTKNRVIYQKIDQVRKNVIFLKSFKIDGLLVLNLMFGLLQHNS